jgi:hypothetical protein
VSDENPEGITATEAIRRMDEKEKELREEFRQNSALRIALAKWAALKGDENAAAALDQLGIPWRVGK